MTIYDLWHDVPNLIICNKEFDGKYIYCIMTFEQNNIIDTTLNFDRLPEICGVHRKLPSIDLDPLRFYLFVQHDKHGRNFNELENTLMSMLRSEIRETYGKK